MMISFNLRPSCSVAAGFEPATSRWHSKPLSERRLQSPLRNSIVNGKAAFPSLEKQRRFVMILGASFINAFGDVLPLNFFQCAGAEENKVENKEEGLMEGVLSLFDPNEKTKSGKTLPKSYLKSAREVVKNLRESLKEDVTDTAKFRRSADSAKESIREFMQKWTGQKSVSSEDSYSALVSAIRVLADFYSKKGPTAALPEGIKSKVMDDLNVAEAAL